MKIMSVNSNNDIIVEFQDAYKTHKHICGQNFKNGEVKNPYDPTVYGVGMLGHGKYITGETGNLTREYETWKNMIRRCYSPKLKEKQKSYYGITTVCSEWLNFQNFAEWYCSNYYELDERLHIDKDILYPCNTVYSPDTCLLVPQRINELFIYRPKTNGLPSGINQRKSGKFTASLCGKNLGTYISVEEAYSVYASAKERIIKEVANEYRDKIPSKVYNALYNYKVNINNDKNYKNCV